MKISFHKTAQKCNQTDLMLFESIAIHTIIHMRQFCYNKEQASRPFPIGYLLINSSRDVWIMLRFFLPQSKLGSCAQTDLMLFESMAIHTIVRMRQFYYNKEQASRPFPIGYLLINSSRDVWIMLRFFLPQSKLGSCAQSAPQQSQCNRVYD